VPPPGGVRETEYVVDPEKEELRDRIRSLRTALALTALLATAALGIGLYTLLAEDEEQGVDRRGASPARVAALDDRVDELENRVGDRATKNQLDQIEQRQERLEGQIEQAGEAGGDAEAVQQSVEQINADVQALEQRVDELAAQQGEEGTTQP
jgi:3-phenylpropionate/cinnamic acid dioxygenase small subunit